MCDGCVESVCGVSRGLEGTPELERQGTRNLTRSAKKLRRLIVDKLSVHERTNVHTTEHPR